MSDTAGETPQYEEPDDDDPTWWVTKPSETRHGIRVVDHDGTLFVEQVDVRGNERQSIMVGATDFDEVQRLANALTEVRARHE